MEEILSNCWEIKDCGREPNGRNVSLYGVCPVSVEFSLDGIHNGKNGGRCCWALAPGISKGNSNVVISCYEKALVCRSCNFYNLVKKTTALAVKV